jgi:CAAX protease family protein
MESDPALPPEPDLPAVPEPALCRSCGTVLRDGSSFCPGCGEPLKAGLTRPPPRPTARQILHDVQGSTSPLRGVIGFYLLWLIAGIVSVAAVSAGAVAVHIMMAVDVFTFAATVGWAAAFRREVFGLLAFPKKERVWLVYPVLLAWPIAALINLFGSWLNGLIGAEFSYTALFLQHGFGWGWIILSICIQPAVVEELAFRGILQTTLGDTMRPKEAIAVAAVAFSIMHWNGALLVPFFFLGAYFGWMRHRTESLWPAMIAHFLHNLLIVLDERISILPG